MCHKDEGRRLFNLSFWRGSAVSLCMPDTYFLKNLRIPNASVWNCPRGSEAVAGNEGRAQTPAGCVLSNLIPFGELAVRRLLLKMGGKTNSKPNYYVLSFEWKIFLLKMQKIQYTCIAWWFTCDVMLKEKMMLLLWKSLTHLLCKDISERIAHRCSSTAIGESQSLVQSELLWPLASRYTRQSCSEQGQIALHLKRQRSYIYTRIHTLLHCC